MFPSSRQTSAPASPPPLRPGAMPATPTVTVAIPALNEARHIEGIVRGFLASPYPHLLEVLVADGGSSDGTREILTRLAAEDPRVRWVPNPERSQSWGLNWLFAQARGEVFLRADAHSDYAADYLERCVEALVRSGALNAGGAQRFVATNAFEAGVALAARSPFGTGGAKYRDPRYSGFADTVYLGCFWRWALEAVTPEGALGPFDPRQVTNQDAELNMRLRALHPQAIFVSAEVQAWYHPRSGPRKLVRQYFRYGRGRCLSAAKHPGRTPWRSLLPFGAVSLAVLCALLDVGLTGGRSGSWALFALGTALALAEGLRVTSLEAGAFASQCWRGAAEAMPAWWVRWLWCSAVIAAMPLAHCAGFAYQTLRLRTLPEAAWAPQR